MSDITLQQLAAAIRYLQNDVQSLQARVKQLEDAQINPYNLVSFTTVAICGKMNLKPIAMAPNLMGPSTQVSIPGNAAYKYDLEILRSLAIRHKLVE